MSKNESNRKKALIKTFGCQMNEHESEKIMGILGQLGYDSCSEAKSADIIVYNTCCVRGHAELKVFGNIGALAKLKDEKPDLIVAVCGCMMQQEDVAKKLYKRFPFINIVFGTNSLHDLERYIEKAKQKERIFDVPDCDGSIIEDLPVLRKNSHNAYVAIMYGCNNFCTYCIVPYVRGRERSRDPRQIMIEIKELASNGTGEIMLLGQNVNSYSGNGMTFPDLLEEISCIDGIKRIRFMTSHPKDLSPELIKAISRKSNLCNHIHLPVQSGSNRILGLMNRGYTREKYLDLIGQIRAGIAGVEITSDVIVGFPGETERDFEETLNLVEAAQFSAAYTFMYSQREGTKAATMPSQVSSSEKKLRLHRLNELQSAICKIGNEKYLNSVAEILIEGTDESDPNRQFGKTANNKTVYFDNAGGSIGDMARVIITSAKNNSLLGKII